MSDVLNSLLSEYEQKKVRAELDLERRKNNLFSLFPRLKEIDDELNNSAFSATKNILSNSANTKDCLDNLQKKIENLKKEKESILVSNNYPKDYLKPFYECKLCNDTGYVTKNNYETEMCSCLKQKLLDISFNKSNMSNLDKENFDTFNANLYSDDVDIAKYKFNISPRTNILNIKQKCIEFVENFDNPDFKNLLFTGNTGLRKDFYV